MAAGIPGPRENLQDDTRNVLLTLSPIWVTLATGQIRSKEAAADWVLEQLPPDQQPVMAHARAIYLGQAEERWEEGLFTRIPSHVDYLLEEIKGLLA